MPVLMTNFPTILNRLTGMFDQDRADFIASFDEYDLLVIDDLGVERSTEYALSLIHICSLGKEQEKMIVATDNLSKEYDGVYRVQDKCADDNLAAKKKTFLFQHK